MNRRLLWAAVTAGWLAGAAGAWAQGYGPSPYGAPPMPEPTPTAFTTTFGSSSEPRPVPPLVPGPLNAQLAPPGPSQDFTLPENHSGAFQAETTGADEGVFFHLGVLALQRDGLGSQPVGFFDPVPIDRTTTTQTFKVEDFRDVTHPYFMGMCGTLGYFWNGQVIECSAFGIFDAKRGLGAAARSSIDVPFTNAPTGFEGDQGLWRQADAVLTTFNTSLTNVELNYRYSDFAFLDTELIMGARYINLRDKLVVATDDGAFGVNQLPTPPTGANVAAYAVQTHNSMIASQIGLECLMHCPRIRGTIGFYGKTGLGPNFASVQTSLTRGDGLVGFQNNRSERNYLGQIYDAGCFLDLNILERFKMHFGYSALLIGNVTLGMDQFDYNLGNPAGRINNNGWVFYHGPALEFQFLF